MIKRNVLLLCIALGATSILAQSDADKYLLPKRCIPERYDIMLQTAIENFDPNNDETFVYQGVVSLTFFVTEGNDNVTDIVVHRHQDIELVGLAIISFNDTSANISATLGNYDIETQKQVITFSKNLIPGTYYLFDMSFTGKNNRDLNGFYRSSYTDSSGATKWLLTTHFESQNARRAFPCLDEPALKATFQLSSVINRTLYDQGYRAISNTHAVIDDTSVEGYVITAFERTARRMSTYLVAFIVSDFSSSPAPAYFNSSFNGENNIKPFSTFGQRKYFEPKRQDILSQTAGPAALNVMTDLTGVGFGLRKVDQAGIPDFSPGAMENYGMVTYREGALFYDENVDPITSLQGNVRTITHELSHQWFGDLVTLHWWTDLWLNEGFATFFAYHATNEIHVDGLDTSDWDLIGQQLTGSIQKTALVADSVKNRSRPLTYETYIPSVINGLFDSMSYDKGGAVLRMIHNSIGREAFYKGLNIYLNNWAENVGTPERLLAGWDEATNFSVSELYKDWHLQAGYPLLTVTKDDTSYTISQKRFFSDGSTDDSTWNIPITYSSELAPNFNDTTPPAYLRKEDSVLIIVGLGNPKWIVLNNQASGYYRVDYYDDNWAALLNVLNDPNTASQIHPYNRAQILDDYAVLTKTGRRSVSMLLKFLFTLRHERNFVPWSTAIRHIEFLLSQFNDDCKILPLLKNFVKTIAEPILNDFTLNIDKSEPATKRLLRRELLGLLCKVQSDICTKNLMEIYQSGTLHPDLRKAAICETMRQGAVNPNDYLEKLKESSFSVMKDITEGFACLQNSVVFLNTIRLLNLNELKIALLEGANNNKLSAAIWKNLDSNSEFIRSLRPRESDEFFNNLADNLQINVPPRSVAEIPFVQQAQRNMKWTQAVREEVFDFFEKNY